jgi:hypothetical protein
MTIRLLAALAGISAAGSAPDIQTSEERRGTTPRGVESAPPASGLATATGVGPVQLTSGKTGVTVTCTMRIARADPTTDAGIFRTVGPPTPGGSTPVVRNDASPCVE